LSLSPERQLVSDVTADEGFLCDTTNALWETILEILRICKILYFTSAQALCNVSQHAHILRRVISTPPNYQGDKIRDEVDEACATMGKKNTYIQTYTSIIGQLERNKTSWKTLA
jgi:hypothetical protein